MALTDDLFQSIDTIVSARIAKLPYDQTIECEVVNVDKAEDNIYTVRYQAATFEAISPSIQYSIGDRVYVAIPQNDYTQNKIILNKKQEDEMQVAKTLPFLSFAYNSNSNLFNYTQQNKELTLNTKSSKIEELIQVPMDLLTEPIAGYTHLGFKCSISSNILQLMKSGDYGIKIELHGFKQDTIMYPYSTAINSNNIEHTFEFYLKTADMINANYYNTLGYCNQEKVFDITNYVIDSIKVYLWQDSNFKTVDNVSVINKIINFTNFQLYFGYDISDFKKLQSRIYLYSKDGLLYNSEFKQKNLYVRYVKFIDNELNELNINIDNSWKFYWEQYDNTVIEKSLYSELLSYKTLNATNPTTIRINLLPSRAFKNQQFVYTLYQEITNTKIISNILTFTNFAYIENSEVLDILTGLSVEPVVEDGYNGIYYIYGQDNYTTDQIVTSKTHYLQLSYIPVASLDSTQGFKPGDIISWTYPKNYTMLIPDLSQGQYSIVEDLDGNEVKDKITLILSANDIDTNGKFNIPYLIKEYYSPQNTNNTIEIEMERASETYTTKFEFSFGTSGSQGAEYIIVPYLLYNNNKVKAITQSYGESAKYILDCDIYDYNNNKINKDDSNIQITYQVIENKGFNIINSNIIQIKSSLTSLSTFYGLIKILGNIYGKNIVAYYPIPITKNMHYKAINGSTIITYDITGKKPFYNKNKLLLNKDGLIANNIIWKIGYYDQQNNFHNDTDNGELKAWPKIIDGELNLPSILHNQLSSCKMLLLGYDDNILIWAQPLIIIQNKYPIGLEHNESNLVEIEDNIFIKNAMVGQVKQNYINDKWDANLSGVFIGNLDNKNLEKEEFGLFGYHQGSRFFQLSEDGYVYLNGSNNDNSETAGIIIDNALIRTSTFEDVDLIGNLNFKTNNFLIKNNNNIQIFSLNQDGDLTITGNLIADNFIGTVTTASFATTAAFATRATGDSISEMTIHNKFEKIKTALNTLASKHTGTILDLW